MRTQRFTTATAFRLKAEATSLVSYAESRSTIARQVLAAAL